MPTSLTHANSLKAGAFSENSRTTEHCRAWAEQQSALTVPAGAPHPIDAFIAQKIERAVAEAAKTPAADAQKFHGDVLSILREECFRCHGDKEKGGLKLNSRAAALAGGEPKIPAIVPT